MSAIAGFDLTPNAGSSLRKMTQMGLEPDLDKYDVIRCVFLFFLKRQL